jgi:DNA gyrase subunit A
VINIRTEGRNGRVVAVALAREGDDALFITQTGMIVRTPVNEISSMGRNTQGVRLVNLKDGDRLVALEIVSEQDLERYASEAAARPPRTAPILDAPSSSADDDGDEEFEDEGAPDEE